MTDRTIVLDRVKREFAEGPAGHVLGARLDYCENGVARVKLSHREQWEDAQGDLASGAIVMLAELATRLAVASLSPRATAQLIDFKINHLGYERGDLLAIGEVVFRKPGLAVCRLEVLQRLDRSIAMGMATYTLSED